MSANDSKRKAEPGAYKNPKKAKFFSTNKDASLPLGVRGFLISCISGKEQVAGQEAIRLIQSYYDDLLPKQPQEKSETDISKLISSEVEDLKDKKKQIFTTHKTAIPGLLCIVMAKDAPGPGPVDIVIKLGEDVKKTRQCRSRYCMRFTPVEDICEASLEAITSAASSIVAPHFPEKNAESPVQTFAVHYEHRASCKLARLQVINAVLTDVKQPPYKADLKNPAQTIVVSAVKGFAAISVVPQFRQLAKFNFKELSVMEDKKDDSSQAVEAPENGSAAEKGEAKEGAEEEVKEEAKEEAKQ